MCYHFFAAFHTNLLCTFAQKKRLPSQATAFFSANILVHIHTKKAITFSGDRVFLRKHTQKKRLPSQATAFFSANTHKKKRLPSQATAFFSANILVHLHTKKAITFSGDRFESSIGISFF